MNRLHDFAGEAIGTCILVFFGCGSVAAAVLFSAHAGLNPARDLSLRLFAWLAGWGNAAMPDAGYGFLTVYVLGPLAGGSLASFFFAAFIQLLMNNKNRAGCGCRK